MWLQRISLVLLVAVCVYLGLLLAVLPWTHLWTENPLLLRLPVRWAQWLLSGTARGLCSGIGILDVWIGVQEISIWHAHRAREKNRR